MQIVFELSTLKNVDNFNFYIKILLSEVISLHRANSLS